MENNMCKCPHHKIVPILIILIGLTFLLGVLNILTSSFVDLAWPVLLILIGMQKLMAGKCKCC